MAQSTISYLWRDQKAANGFRAGVSLHSHTNQSKETLDFLANLGNTLSRAAPGARAARAPIPVHARCARGLCGQLLDSAHDAQAGL